MSENKNKLLHLPIRKRKPIPDIEYRRYEGELREKIGHFCEHIDAVWGGNLAEEAKFKNGFSLEYFLVAFLEVFDVKLKTKTKLDALLKRKYEELRDGQLNLEKNNLGGTDEMQRN